jgi:uncharacterized protein (DUF427 family)
MSRDVPPWLAAARSKWSNTGERRPYFAVGPQPGQESVWDYPRPPIVVADRRRVRVGDSEPLLADSLTAVRVLETAGPPTFYLPPDDVDRERLVPAPGSSLCEWKGRARYWALSDRPEVPIGWDYPAPFVEFAVLTGHLSFYPARIRCLVDDEVVRPQEGGFYGGWVTDEIVGPFKGDRGTQGW